MTRSIPDGPRAWFNLLVKESAAGRFPSSDEYFCLYRGPGDRRCAVGHLIPDEKYVSKMESLGARYLFLAFPDVKPEWLGGEDASDVQSCHDDQARAGKAWDHDKFVTRLRACNVFRDLNTEETTRCE